MKIRHEDIETEDHDHFQGRRHPSRETRRPERRFRERAADDATFNEQKTRVEQNPTPTLEEPMPMTNTETAVAHNPVHHIPTRKEQTTMKTNTDSCIAQVISLPVRPESFCFLDALIEQERARYANERVTFHDYFWCETVRDVLRILRRGAGVSEYDAAEWSETVETLLEAHEYEPHDLWTLFLVAAFETPIHRCREMLGDPEHATARDLDRVVWKAFFETLETYPRSTTIEVLPSVLVRRFRGAARRAADAIEARRRVRGAPPREGGVGSRDGGRVVLLVGEESCDVMAETKRG